MPTSSSVAHSAPAIGVVFTPDGDIGQYANSAKRARVAEAPPDGMLIHWAIERLYGVTTCSIWRTRELAEAFLSDVLANALTETAGEVARSGARSPDISYQLWPIETFVAGPAASAASGRAVGEAGGAIVCTPTLQGTDASYRAAATALGIATDPPESLIGHVVAIADDGPRWLDVWLDSKSSTGYYQGAGSSLGDIARSHLHTLVVNPIDLEILPSVGLPDASSQ
jgi:hypothetical protein